MHIQLASWWRWGWLLLTGALAGVAAADQLDIVTLKHKTADAVLPMVRTFLEPGGSASGTGDKLFVRASPANQAEIRRLLAEIDRAARQLRVTVSRDRQQAGTEQQVGVSANIALGNHVRIISGAPAAGDNRFEVGTARGAVGVSGREDVASGRRSGTQSVQVLDGERAFVQIGSSVPVPMQQVVIGPRGAVVSTTTAYRDLGQGFYVRPRLSETRVTIEISQEDSSPGRYGAGSADIARLSTSVSGRLGEWISLGGIDQQTEVASGNGFSQSTRTLSEQRGVWLKVDEIAD